MIKHVKQEYIIENLTNLSFSEGETLKWLWQGLESRYK